MIVLIYNMQNFSLATFPCTRKCFQFSVDYIVKQVKGASKMQKAELQKPFEWTWNMLNYFQSSIAQDLWPQNR